MPRLTAEQIFRGLLKGALATQVQSDSSQWAGITTLASGSATIVISTTAVDSNSLILMSPLGNANFSSGAALRSIEVKTISEGNYFTLGTNDGIANPRDTLLHWMIFKAK